MVSARPCSEWFHFTTCSDSTGSMCALEYSTTPSLPSSTGPSPSTAMIELTLMFGVDGDLLQGLDEVVARRHVVDRRGHDRVHSGLGEI